MFYNIEISLWNLEKKICSKWLVKRKIRLMLLLWRFFHFDLVKISEVIQAVLKGFCWWCFPVQQIWQHSSGPVGANFSNIDRYFCSTALSTFAALRFDRIYKIQGIPISSQISLQYSFRFAKIIWSSENTAYVMLTFVLMWISNCVK